MEKITIRQCFRVRLIGENGTKCNMKRLEEIIIYVIFFIAYLAIVFMLRSILPLGPSSVRYEVALAIIGSVITVMGILIAFEITFPAGIFHKQIESIFGFLYDYKKFLEINGRVPGEMKKYGKGLEERTKKERKRFREFVLLIFIGLGIIVWLIIFAFSWNIDPKTNLISENNFNDLKTLLVIAFGWIIVSLMPFFYSYHEARFGYVLKEFDKIEEIEKKQKNAGKIK